MSNKPVPFLDLVSPHRELEDELVDVFRRALRSAAFDDYGGTRVTLHELVDDAQRSGGTVGADTQRDGARVR